MSESVLSKKWLFGSLVTVLGFLGVFLFTNVNAANTSVIKLEETKPIVSKHSEAIHSLERNVVILQESQKSIIKELDKTHENMEKGFDKIEAGLIQLNNKLDSYILKQGK